MRGQSCIRVAKGAKLTETPLFDNLHTNTLLTKNQLASLMQVSLSTVDNWIAKGMPHVKLGKLVRVNLGEVTEWHQRKT
jgi:excisionase family DNA binding protein